MLTGKWTAERSMLLYLRVKSFRVLVCIQYFDL